MFFNTHTLIESQTPNEGFLTEVVIHVFIMELLLQIRLDFDTFVITGPSTATVTGKWLTWVLEPEVYTTETQCSTDIFGVTGVPSVPNVCGTLTGDHCEFELVTYVFIFSSC